MGIVVTRVTKTYGTAPAVTRALTGIDLTIDEPATVALVGPSGSGKSTLLHLIGALDYVSGGTITVDGRELTQLNPRALADYRSGVGFVFQRYNLLPQLTAIENVTLPVLTRRTSFDKTARAISLLTRVGLAGKTTRLPGQLSGGEQQRVAIARALMNEPGVILADEPTGNLDSTTAVEIVDLLLDLRAETAATMLIATHDPGVAARCDRILTLRDGAIVDDTALDAAAPAERTWADISGPGRS